MQPMHNTMSENVRTQSVELLNKHLTAAIDLHDRMALAHWNVRGQGFIAIHELFDKVSMVVKYYSDLIADRSDGLDGAASGSFRNAAERGSPDFADEHRHVFAVSGMLAAFGRSAQDAAAQATEIGDTDTASLFDEISRGIDNQLWFVESHIAPRMNEEPRSQLRRQTRGNGSPSGRPPERASDRHLSALKARRAASEMHEHIEIHDNENYARCEAN